MKQLLIIILGLSLMGFQSASLIIAFNEKVLLSFKKKIVEEIKKDIESQPNVKKYCKADFNILVVPTYKVSVSKSRYSIEIDSSKVFAVLKNGNVTFAILSKMGSNYSFLTNELLEPQKKTLRLIDYAIQQSANPFFVYFLKDEKYWDNVISFFDKGKISFIDENLYKYTTLEGIIKCRYGCVEKYLELDADAKLKDELLRLIVNLEDAKAILKKDYVSWESKFPHDTAVVLKLFIVEMDSITKLSPEQKALIKQKVLNRIRQYQLKTYTGSGIPFYGEDIYQEVQTVLTKNQLSKYLEKRALNDWLASKASNKLYYYFKKERNFPDSKIDSLYKHDVFGK